LSKEELFHDNSKPVERQGRKASGPVKWQPATENEVFLFVPSDKGKPVERQGRKATGPENGSQLPKGEKPT